MKIFGVFIISIHKVSILKVFRSIFPFHYDAFKTPDHTPRSYTQRKKHFTFYFYVKLLFVHPWLLHYANIVLSISSVICSAIMADVRE